MWLNSIDSVLMNNEFKPFWFKNEAQLAFIENLFVKNLPGLFTSLWRLHADRNCTTPSMVINRSMCGSRQSSFVELSIFAMSRSETLFKSPISFGEQIISFKKAKIPFGEQKLSFKRGQQSRRGANNKLTG